jgi:hypothetical protein
MNLSHHRDDNGDPCTRGWTKEFSLRPFRSQTVPQPATIRFNRGGLPWPLCNLILALHPYGGGMAWTSSKVCASCYSARCPCCYRSQSNRYCGQHSRRFEAKVCCPECPFVASVSGKGPHPLQDPVLKMPSQACCIQAMVFGVPSTVITVGIAGASQRSCHASPTAPRRTV